MTTSVGELLLGAALTLVPASAAGGEEQPLTPARPRDASRTPSSALVGPGGSEGAKAPIEHTVILGVGGASELELSGGSLRPGANVFVEYEAIENWLELELGASVLSAEGGLEVPIDLLAKKPFRLSRGVEFMVGLGPEIVRVTGGDKNGTFGGIEFALDFMFWPLQRVGLWIEPSYDVVFRGGASHGIGSTGGLILGW